MEKIIRKAQGLAQKKQETLFIVNDEGYQIATEYDMDTFFQGYEPIVAILSDGTVER